MSYQDEITRRDWNVADLRATIFPAEPGETRLGFQGPWIETLHMDTGDAFDHCESYPNLMAAVLAVSSAGVRLIDVDPRQRHPPST